MSEKTIARWNAIPFNREEGQPVPITLKRRRDDHDDDDDDDISLVSRSPSPAVHDSMDVDENHIHKYDDYVRGSAREVVTVETKIKPTNKGFAMLAKLGWVEGQPIGLSSDGLTEPIPFHVKTDSTGLGKISQDVRMIETTVSQRRGLDSERQQKENEEQRRLREDNVARKNALNTEISSTLRAFYCSLCEKQFKTVAQYDEHTNSYAHHHKARFRDMQANVRVKAKEEVDKQKEKERKREEKELRKIAAANGIKIPSSTIAAAPVPESGSLATASGIGMCMSMDIDGGNPVAEPKTGGGWASLSAFQGSVHSQGGFKKSGWATIGPSSSSNPLTPSISVIDRHSSQTPPSHITRYHNPTFRNAGWSSLDTGSSQPLPAPNTSETGSSSHSWSKGFTTSRDESASGQQGSIEPTDPTLPSESEALSLVPQTMPKPAQVPQANAPRSNWQQFQKGVGRRK